MKINSKIIILILFILTFLIFILQSCDKKIEDIRIGLIADLTGPMALYGGWVKNGVDIAVEEIMNKSKVEDISIKLLFEDSRSDPKTAVSAIQKLISLDKVGIIIGGNGSSSIMAMAPIANEKKTILFATLASSPTITNAGDYIFRNRISGLFEAKYMAKVAFNRGFKHVAVAAINNEAGIPYIDVFKNEFNSFGGEVVARELFKPDETNLRTQVLKLKNENPEAVFTVLQAEQAAHLMEQSIELNFKPFWLGISSLKSDKLLGIGKNVTDNIIIATEGIDKTNKKYMSFSKQYKSKFGEDPSIYAVNGYDAVMVLSTIISEVGTNPENIKNALYNLTGYVGAGGSLRFDENGDAIRIIKLMKVRNDEFIMLDE